MKSSCFNYKDYLCYFILLFLTLLIAVACYHPYYFGDELMPFYFAQKDNSLFSVFLSLNWYKPRFIYNGIWALVAHYGMPRYVLMYVIVASLSAMAFCIYYAYQKRGAGIIISLCAGIAVVLSRFSFVAYYDYIAGTIESIALCFFLLAIMMTFKYGFLSRAGFCVKFMVFFLCLLSVFTHERYAAGVMVLGVIVIISSIKLKNGVKNVNINKNNIFWGLSILIVPLSLFALFTKYLSKLSLYTGTAGSRVAFSPDIFLRATQYAKNVFLAQNNGPEWLVGSLQTMNWGKEIILFLSVMFFLFYMYVFLLRRSEVCWKEILFLSFIMGALILVASIPGNIENRWMTPLLVFMLYGALYLGSSKKILIILIFIVNICYAVSGSYMGIYNVFSSKIAMAVASSLNNVVPLGAHGLLLNDDAQWVLGGDELFGNNVHSGAVFSKINMDSITQIDPESSPGKEYDFGLYNIGSNYNPQFAYINKKYLDIIRMPQLADKESLIDIGSEVTWSKWSWNKSYVTEGDSVEIRPGDVGTIELEPANMDRCLIVYTAEAVAGNSVPFRIQVNWLDGNGRLLKAFIKVFYATAEYNNFVAFISAPKNAKKGVIYANLHDGADGVIALRRVSLIKSVE